MPFEVLEFLGCGNVGSDYLSVFVRAGDEDTALRALTQYIDKTRAVDQDETPSEKAWQP